MKSERRRHAVVLGGSMGGLLAARALTNHFEQVTLIDRDRFPEIGSQRRGVPQGRHSHGLLASGRLVLERYFPGLTRQLVAAGAISCDIVNNSRWVFEGAPLCRCQSGLDGLVLSRPLLEGTVRHRLRQLPNLAIRECTVAEGVASDEEKRRVTGVRVASEGGQTETIDCDLLVDATGRGSHTPEWLTEMGYAKPEVDRIDIGISYTTRLFRRRAEDAGGDVAMVIPPTPEGKRGGVMLAQEGGRWTVTLIAHFVKGAPEELEGFRDFAGLLASPDIHDVIRTAEPVSDPVSAHFPASVRRRFERLVRFPEGFLAIGDSICSFNPIYGQGMSVSAQEAVALDECLAAGDDRLAKRFFAAAARVVDIPWSTAVGNDLRIPETKGPRSAGVSFINWYVAKLHRAAHHDPVPALAFHQVANLLAAPPTILAPRIAWRVLKGNLFRPAHRPENAAHQATRSASAAK